MSLLTLSELRDMRELMTSDELLELCRDAAATAVRAPYTPDQRADCAATLYSDAVALVMRGQLDPEITRVRTGRPADVLAYIDRMSDPSNHPHRERCAMPRRDDSRFTFTALRNRAHDWRRKLEAAAEHDALMAGRDEREPEPEDRCPADYLTVGARQDANAARRAATDACALIGAAPGAPDKPSPVWTVFYVWARNQDAAQCAPELGIAPDAIAQRMSRAARALRKDTTAAELVAALTAGAPIELADGTLRYALRDDSRDAHGRTPIMASEPRSAPQDAAPVTFLKSTPDPDAAQRRIDRQNERADARALRRLGRAQGATRAVHAGTGRAQVRVGRTAGKPEERYAPRSVRLGDR